MVVSMATKRTTWSLSSKWKQVLCRMTGVTVATGPGELPHLCRAGPKRAHLQAVKPRFRHFYYYSLLISVNSFSDCWQQQQSNNRQLNASVCSQAPKNGSVTFKLPI